MFNIKLAEKIFTIENKHPYIEDLCKDYLTTEPSQLFIEATAEEIAKENHDDGSWSDAYLETLAVYRKIAEKMPAFDTVLFHGSVIAVDGTGYLFTAKSGTGKSTHTRLWKKYFGERAVMVNDDKPLLKVTKNGVVAYGTPWNGKHRLGTNISVPLKTICVLTRDTVNHIEEVKAKDVYPILLRQTYRPKDKLSMVKTLKLIDQLIKTTKFYRLGCNMSANAAKVAFEGMNGGIM